jgi:GTPase
MKKVIFFAAILYSGICSAQINWEKVNITDNVSISFPSSPVKNEPTAGNFSYILKQADSTANYIVAASNVGEALGVDAETLAAEMEKEESWDQAKTAFANSLGKDATLIKDEITNVKNTKAMRLVFNRKTAKGGTNVLTVLIFVNGTISYNVMFNSRDGKGSETMKEAFFNSIDIK